MYMCSRPCLVVFFMCVTVGFDTIAVLSNLFNRKMLLVSISKFKVLLAAKESDPFA